MSFLYLSLAGEEQLACYRVDGETGDLEHLRNEPVPGAPSVQGRHCRLPVLYAAMRSNGRLVSFRIDAGKRPARPSPHHRHRSRGPGLPADRPQRALAPDPLLRLGQGHRLPGRRGRRRARAPFLRRRHRSARPRPGPRSGEPLPLRPSYLPCQRHLPAAVRRRHARGRTTLPRWSAGAELGPRHVHFHPDGRWLYAGNEQGNSVTQYRFDEGSGTLSPLRTTDHSAPRFQRRRHRPHADPSGRPLPLRRQQGPRQHRLLRDLGNHRGAGAARARGDAGDAPLLRHRAGRALPVRRRERAPTGWRSTASTGIQEPSSRCGRMKPGGIPWWVQVVDPEAGL